MTKVIGSRRMLARRREILEELQQVALTLRTADVLDRTADRLANPRLAAVLHERAEERRQVASFVRAEVAARAS